MESSRKKSCNQCRLAKTRCSLETAGCSRCRKKELTCKYERQQSRVTSTPSVEEGTFHSWLAGTNQSSPLTVPHGALSPFNSNDAPNLSNNLSQDSGRVELHFSADPVPTDLSGPIEWNVLQDIPSPERSLTNPFVLTNSTPDQNTLNNDSRWFGNQPSQSGDLNLANGPFAPGTAIETIDPLFSMSNVVQQASDLVLASWQVLKDIPNHVLTLLDRKQGTNLATIMISNHLWATVESFIDDLDRQVLPPFIHRSAATKHLGGRELDFVNLPEAIANCKQIMLLYSHKTPSNEMLVHKTFVFEVQRLHNEAPKYSQQSLIYALQAITVYSILLAKDPMRCTKLSICVRIVMGEIATQVYQNMIESIGERRGNYSSWEAWIYEESERRTLVLLHVIDLLVETQIAPPPPSGCSQLAQILLPCSKAMWEAETSSAWEVECSKYLRNRKRGEDLHCGHLRLLKESNLNEATPDMVEDLSTWSKGADGLGALLLIATQM